MELTTTVYSKLPANFDMAGQFLGYPLRHTNEKISYGLAVRLARHAAHRLVSSGFDVSGWLCEVETLDDQDKPSERTYHVTFTNALGGSLGVQGILLTRFGWPCLDHGLFIEQ